MKLLDICSFIQSSDLEHNYIQNLQNPLAVMLNASNVDPSDAPHALQHSNESGMAGIIEVKLFLILHALRGPSCHQMRFYRAFANSKLRISQCHFQSPCHCFFPRSISCLTFPILSSPFSSISSNPPNGLGPAPDAASGLVTVGVLLWLP